MALKYPNVFENVLSESGSYYRDDCFVIKAYKESRNLKTKTYLTCGILEDRPYDEECPTMMDFVCKMRDVLKYKNYEVKFETFPSGHDFLSWGEYLARGLIALIPSITNK